MRFRHAEQAPRAQLLKKLRSQIGRAGRLPDSEEQNAGGEETTKIRKGERR